MAAHSGRGRADAMQKLPEKEYMNAKTAWQQEQDNPEVAGPDWRKRPNSSRIFARQVSR